MANAKICDRCGGIYNITVYGTLNAFETLAQTISSFAKTCDTITVSKNGVPVDLCPDCSKELKKWLNGGGLDD